MDDAPSEPGRPGSYFSYLLRLWREGDEGTGWRASLHDPHTGERMGFASLDELFEHLRKQTGTPPGPDGGPERAERGGDGTATEEEQRGVPRELD
jgi:hypothetical protein